MEASRISSRPKTPSARVRERDNDPQLLALNRKRKAGQQGGIRAAPGRPADHETQPTQLLSKRRGTPAPEEEEEEEEDKEEDEEEDAAHMVSDSEEVALLKVVDKELDLSNLSVLRYESFWRVLLKDKEKTTNRRFFKSTNNAFTDARTFAASSVPSKELDLKRTKVTAYHQGLAQKHFYVTDVQLNSEYTAVLERALR